MTSNSHHNTMIYNKLHCCFVSLLFAALLLCVNTVHAAQSGGVSFDDYLMDYSRLHPSQIRTEADFYYNKAADSQTSAERDEFIEIAQAKYYILTMLDHEDIAAAIQLARIYDYRNKNRLAKEYFFKATNLDAYNPYANQYFGDFYYKRKDYKRAINYYKIAHENGLRNKYELNYNMAVIYEKLADLPRARLYYSACLAATPNNAELREKIRSLESEK